MCMHSATIGGLGLFFTFAVSLGVFSLIAFLGAGDIGGAIAGALIIIMCIVLSPILATIVCVIIGNNYDDGITAIWNGALVGAMGTVIMVVVSTLVMLIAIVVPNLSESSDDDSDDDSDGSIDAIRPLLLAGGAVLVPATIGGALGAFIGCTFLESGGGSTRLSSRNETGASFGTKRWQGGHHDLTKRSAPLFASGQTKTTIQCPSCGSNMTVPKLGQLQKVKCDSCGMEGEIKI